jgi:hypothetical protein
MNTESQSNWILTQLRNGRKLSAYEALQEAGCFRLAARINDLRKKGYTIKTIQANSGNKHFAVYYLEH